MVLEIYASSLCIDVLPKMNEIFRTLSEVEKYVEGRGGMLTVHIYIGTPEIVDIQVDYKGVEGVPDGGFGVETDVGDFRALHRDLERMLDESFGPGWREVV